MKPSLLGATLEPNGICTWRTWAPRAHSVQLILCDAAGREQQSHEMLRDTGGRYWIQLADQVPGRRYGFRLDGGPVRPDPASRWQPQGVHSASALWCPNTFHWQDHSWSGGPLVDLVIYELHTGTFTPQGNFAAIIPRLRELRDLGITALELMPIAQFPGNHGWGYDGVHWFAVQESYGGPLELQRLVDACHSHGLGVILDVVYNHLGPEGNYLGEFGPIFTDRHHTPWGSAINFDGPDSLGVRDLVLDNVRLWIRDFHVDGLRLDAVHAIYDDSSHSILAEIKQVAVDEARRLGRSVHVIAESNLNDVKVLCREADGGYELDAQWSDDFHHAVHALLTGERDGYYVDFSDPPRQLAKAIENVFVFDGGFSSYRQRCHGRPVGGHGGERFIISIQTHDQVGNRAHGERFGELLTPAQLRLAAGLLLLTPNLPLLFMGEEYGETNRFAFFCDFGDPTLREAVTRGRQREFDGFAWARELPDPNSPATRDAAVLSWNWPAETWHAGLRSLYRELLALRRGHPALRDFRHRTARLWPGTGTPMILVLERGEHGSPQNQLAAVFNLLDRAVNVASIVAEAGEVLLCSDDRRFGGTGKFASGSFELPPFSFVLWNQPKETPS